MSLKEVFLHESANNQITRKNINVGSSNTILNNQRQMYHKLKPNKYTRSGWSNRCDFVEPTIRLCKTCCTQHWETNIDNLLNTIKSKPEFVEFIQETPQYVLFLVGHSDRIITVCRSGSHIL
eukprot:221852_1